MIRFRFNPHKALQAVLWLSQRKPGITLHTVAKVCFYADKNHLNQYGRPVFGDTYRAMQFGPVGTGVYEMMKGDPMYLEAVDREAYPFALSGRHVRPSPGEAADMSVFSESDLEVLEASFRENGNLSFSALVDKTHAEKAYQEVPMNAWMNYEALVDEREDRAEILEDLEAVGNRLVI